MAEAVVRIKDLVKIYRMGEIDVQAVRGITVDILRANFTAIVGPSGCGKSTLMHIVGCLDRPTSGSVLLEGIDILKQSDDQLAEIRRKKVGFVFQTFNLLPRITAVENVELPLIYSGIGVKERRQKALSVLEKVGLADRANHRPPEMSGGQRQRVAIARALINDPAILLADEPTGNLDSKSGEDVMALFEQLDAEGVTIIMVTHNPDLARRCERSIHLKDGQVVSDEIHRENQYEDNR
ncbi:MAG: ABC transporter ATP-binding protein [bacterium]